MRFFRVVLLAMVLAGCASDPVDENRRHSLADTDAEDTRSERDAPDADSSSGESTHDSLPDRRDADTDRDREDTADVPVREDVDGGGQPGEDTGVRPDKGTELGTFFNTYYYLADEAGYSGGDDTILYDHHCDPLAEVPSDFADAACIEGSARLEDGTVINYHSPCSCGPCSFCWSEMDPNTHPWGMGSRGNALEPLRSWAVDTDVLTHGSVVYVEEWDGVDIPQIGDLGGFVHDGCFRVDDVGGGISGNHFDYFAGTPQMWQALEAIYPTRTDFAVYGDSPRCE